MTPENQNIEWKRSWRDEYLAWVCGFANAQGGVLQIGKNDRGQVVGVTGVLSLMEDIPNKVRALLGIVVEVNLHSDEAGLEYIEIVVEPHTNPISYRGKVHYRSGSTKQVLEGAALTRFLLEKHGSSWDDVPLPGVSLADLDGRILDEYRHRGVESQRLPPQILNESDEDVIERLQLRDGAHLRRAAILLFHPEPHLFFMEASVKIGAFRGAELLYQDVIVGDLFTQVDRVIDLLYTKYSHGLVSYDGNYRVETFPVPRRAMREAVVNAVIHRDYATPASTQIRVYHNRITLRNAAQLPHDWTAPAAVGMQSRPHNPKAADGFYRAGMIEAWGRGIRRIGDLCRETGNPAPEWSCEPGGVLCLRFPFPEAYRAAQREARGGGQGTALETRDNQKTARKQPESNQTTARKQPQRESRGIGTRIIALLRRDPSASRREIAAALEDATEGSVRHHLEKLKRAGRLSRIGPDRGGRWVVAESDEPEPEPPENNQTTARTQPENGRIDDRLLAILQRQPTAGRHEIAARLHVTESTVRYRLDRLRKAGRIERIGPDKGGRWKVLDA